MQKWRREAEIFLNHKRPFRLWRFFASLLIFPLLLSGCLGVLSNDDSTAQINNIPSPYVGTVELRCTDVCADRGQCGVAADQNDRVLLSTISPAVSNHDLLALPGTRATIQETIVQSLVNESTQRPLSHPFHRVLFEDGTGTQGWVAEWCVVPVN